MNRNGSTIKTAHNGGSLYAIVQFKFRLSQTGNQSDYGPNWLEWDLVEDIYSMVQSKNSLCPMDDGDS